MSKRHVNYRPPSRGPSEQNDPYLEHFVEEPDEADEAVDEVEVAALHKWIEKILIDPETDVNKKKANVCERCAKQGKNICISKLHQQLQIVASHKGLEKRKRSSSRGRGGGRQTSVSPRAATPLMQQQPVAQNEGMDNHVYSSSACILPAEGRLETNYKYGGDLPHGFFRKMNRFGDVDYFGCFVNGHQHGPVWRSLVGGSYMISSSLDFTSPGTVFLYPDCRTALLGKFHANGALIEARLAEVIGARPHCNKGCTMLWPRLGNVVQDPIFRLDRSTSTCLSRCPRLRDPYEQFFVRVGQSGIPGAGEGLFAITDILEGTVVAFYNGIRVPTKSRTEEPEEDSEEDSDNDEEDDDEYRVHLSEAEDLDIPAEQRDLRLYCATLGHKICHSFEGNCEFDVFFHPRFGLIQSAVSLRDISRGEEITVNYGYDVAVAPVWYKSSWIQYQKKLRGMTDWETALRQRNPENQHRVRSDHDDNSTIKVTEL